MRSTSALRRAVAAALDRPVATASYIPVTFMERNRGLTAALALLALLLTGVLLGQGVGRIGVQLVGVVLAHVGTAS